MYQRYFKHLKAHQAFQWVALGLIGLFSAIALSFYLSEPPLTLRVGFSIWPGYESLYLAKSLGYYNDRVIRLVDYPSNSEIIRAFRNQDLDIATLTMYEALLIAEVNDNVQIILIMDSSNGADVIIGKPNITSLSDLQGKQIGVESGALGAFVFTRAFEQAKLSTSGIEVVSLGVSEHEEAFNKGTINAVVTYEPTRSKLLANGNNLLFDSSQIPGEVLDVLVIRKELTEKNSKALQMLLDGHFKALHYLQMHPQDAAIRIAPREGVTPEQFLESLKGISIPDQAENKKILSNSEQILQERAKRVSAFMAQHKLLRRDIDLTRLFNDRFIPQNPITSELKP